MFKIDFEFDKEKVLKEIKKICLDISERTKEKYDDKYDYFVNQMLYLFPKSLDEFKKDIKEYREKLNEENKKNG